MDGETGPAELDMLIMESTYGNRLHGVGPADRGRFFLHLRVDLSAISRFLPEGACDPRGRGPCAAAPCLEAGCRSICRNQPGGP